MSVDPNSCNHPSRQALTAYRLVGAQAWHTDRQGTITIIVQSDGYYTIVQGRGAGTAGLAVPVCADTSSVRSGCARVLSQLCSGASCGGHSTSPRAPRLPTWAEP